MKIFILSLALCFAALTASAQEYIGSPVNMFKIRADSLTYTAKGIAVISLSKETSQFNVGMFLYPIVTSLNENDSINKINRSYYLNFKAVFPINPLALDNLERDEKNYSVGGILTINGVSKMQKIIIDLYKPIAQDKKTESPDVQSSYPVHISFSIEINPTEFNMDMETIKFTELIVLEVQYGQINRLEN